MSRPSACRSRVNTDAQRYQALEQSAEQCAVAWNRRPGALSADKGARVDPELDDNLSLFWSTVCPRLAGQIVRLASP